ncbi:peptide chain release factor N(5)-glutamine methyltransferase [Marivirga sp. S37H4]|uniref:peptide chain release factor N(5)-glutamine methyltransferase n=1 Tax=Marivirga aurantiaca TaxID=2802615 RepID=A0A934WYE1_9BACT|nr:peptide chain release factor N(5)-glutamine methyltransferase [Marivirga aurantiaca]MBK6265191.1 peptide chain release factor N(5)-glutamine methyltransferase [Marivirga aurantiaca]
MNSKIRFKEIAERLKKFENEQEAESLSYWLLEDIGKISKMDVLVEKEVILSAVEEELLNEAIERLKKHEPIQHILGKVEFYNRQFLVNKNVLIPRQETEELVDLILKDHPDLADEVVVDIGTGSGIIPITIAKERPGVKIYGLDISIAALATAKRNAELNRAKVNFLNIDILEESPELPPAEIWVSNPPYVLESEKMAMEEKVKEYDPAQALFVHDNDPLVFYKRIAYLAKQNLKYGAYLYFEINEKFGEEVKLVMELHGFKELAVIKDMQGKNRFVVGINQ